MLYGSVCLNIFGDLSSQTLNSPSPRDANFVVTCPLKIVPEDELESGLNIVEAGRDFREL